MGNMSRIADVDCLQETSGLILDVYMVSVN